METTLEQLRAAERQARITMDSTLARMMRVGTLHGFGNVKRFEKHKLDDRVINSINACLAANKAIVHKENQPKGEK